ncbi:MAG: phospholipase [Chloroflexia bacterium]
MSNNIEDVMGPHAGAGLRVAGEPVESAKAAMLMVHGRGATAESILLLANELDVSGFTYIAPQAVGNAWYPYPFMTPMERNEPWLSSALSLLGATVRWIEGQGIAAEKIILLGFSQGACLATEFVARNARRYGGIASLSGGLIGPDGTPRDYPGSLEGTPVFLGCSDIDFHIPKERVLGTARVLEELGGEVTARLYPNMDHTINMDEIEFVRGMMEGVKRKT